MSVSTMRGKRNQIAHQGDFDFVINPDDLVADGGQKVEMLLEATTRKPRRKFLQHWKGVDEITSRNHRFGKARDEYLRLLDQILVVFSVLKPIRDANDD